MQRQNILASSGWFAAWTLVGGGLALGALSVFTIGIFVLGITVVIAALLAVRRATWVGLPGLLSGLALPLFFVAYLNRDGPGTICETSVTGGSSCTDRWSPYPWAAAGALLLVAGIALFVVVLAATRRSVPTVGG